MSMFEMYGWKSRFQGFMSASMFLWLRTQRSASCIPQHATGCTTRLDPGLPCYLLHGRRLLQHSPSEAAAVVNAPRPPVTQFADTLSAETQVGSPWASSQPPFAACRVHKCAWDSTLSGLHRPALPKNFAVHASLTVVPTRP